MNKTSIKHIEVSNKMVFLRADFNVPLDENKRITDSRRIDQTIPTLNYLLDQQCRIVIASHLGRPKGSKNPEFSLNPVYEYLKTQINCPVYFSTDCIGPESEGLKSNLEPGEILLLENVRYYSEETDNDPNFSKKLASQCDIFVNDAFGTAHRAHASTSGIAKHVKQSVSGLLIEKELNYLSNAIEHPKRPLTAIIGGAKISGKIDVIDSLFDKVDNILIGGGMVFTFYKSMGLNIGKSLVEEDKVELASMLITKAKEKEVRLLLPIDIMCGKSFSEDTDVEVKSYTELNDDDMGLDIGPQSIDQFTEVILNSKTIVWNGPMGAFELEPFEDGTKKVAQALAQSTQSGCISIIGGGDSAAAVGQFGLDEKMSHISTGGGASLELLEGKTLPGIDVLDDMN
jgi:phosphoglycerate kinase